jgi:hypothetical protein
VRGQAPLELNEINLLGGECASVHREMNVSSVCEDESDRGCHIDTNMSNETFE